MPEPRRPDSRTTTRHRSWRPSLAWAAVAAGLSSGGVSALILMLAELYGPLSGPAATLSAAGIALFAAAAVLVAGNVKAPAEGAAPDHAAPVPSENNSRTSDRYGFEKAVDAALVQSSRLGTDVTVVLIAVDGLEEITSGLGGATADEVLNAIAGELRASIRANEPFSRLSRNVFAVLIQSPQSIRDEADTFARRLHRRFDSVRTIGAEQVKISLQTGISDSSVADSAGALIRMAEVALHEARIGGTRVVHYSASMDEIESMHEHLAKDLIRSLESEDGLSIVYQPVYEPTRQVIVGSEALLRWNHPVHGRLDATYLLDLAVASGVMARLDAWSHGKAVSHLARSPLAWMAVNTSRERMAEPAFADELRQLLNRHALDPERLQIDVSRSVLEDPLAGDNLKALRELGVRIAWDSAEALDAGTGSEEDGILPLVDKIKLGPGIVGNLDSDFSAQAALLRLVRSARSANVAVAAKIVETGQQKDALVNLGVSEVQGHLFAPPVTGSTIDAMIASERKVVGL